MHTGQIMPGEVYHSRLCWQFCSDVIKTFFQDQDPNQEQYFKILSRPRPSLVFKTKIKILHLKTKTKTFLWCILEANRKAFLIFSRKRKCRRKWNSIYDRKRNENENGHSFSTENEIHLIILMFSFIFHTFSLQVSPTMRAPPIPRPVSPFCRWSLLTRFHFPHVQCIDIFVAFF